MIPISRIQKELTRAVKEGATEYFLLNTSDFRPVIMSASAALDIAWNADSWIRNENYHEEFLRDWSGTQFNKNLSDDIASIYSDYYISPAKYGPDETYRMGDNYYTRMTRLYLRRMETEDSMSYMEKVNRAMSVEENAKYLIEICSNAKPRWDSLNTKATQLFSLIAGNRKNFYQSSVLTPIDIHRYGNEMLILVMKAFIAKEINDKKEYLENALLINKKVIESLKKAEYGKWKNFYQNDFMTGFRSAGKCIELTIAKYEGIQTHEDINHFINDWDLWDLVKSYQGKQKVAM
jgi:hypothetical protein